MKNKVIKLTEREKQLINELDHPLYTVDFIQTWINWADNVMAHPVFALQSMRTKGYYEAVHQMAELQRRKERKA